MIVALPNSLRIDESIEISSKNVYPFKESDFNVVIRLHLISFNALPNKNIDLNVFLIKTV